MTRPKGSSIDALLAEYANLASERAELAEELQVDGELMYWNRAREISRRLIEIADRQRAIRLTKSVGPILRGEVRR